MKNINSTEPSVGPSAPVSRRRTKWLSNVRPFFVSSFRTESAKEEEWKPSLFFNLKDFRYEESQKRKEPKMLTLTRKTGENILIGNDIVVEIKEIRGGKVRVGIIAPKSVPIYREELFDRITREEMTRQARETG